MISDKEICQIGSIIKPHGINGEVVAMVNSDVFLLDLKCIVLKIDGINVPFFISSSRPRGTESMLITIDGIKNEREAAKICGLDIYALKCDFDEDGFNDEDEGFYVSDLIGFTMTDAANHLIGKITGYDDSTVNILLLVEDTNGATKYIPMADELIESFNAEDKTISLNLPAGILDL